MNLATIRYLCQVGGMQRVEVINLHVAAGLNVPGHAELENTIPQPMHFNESVEKPCFENSVRLKESRSRAKREAATGRSPRLVRQRGPLSETRVSASRRPPEDGADLLAVLLFGLLWQRFALLARGPYRPFAG